MENNTSEIIKDIDKVNLRIKEFLWKKELSLKTWGIKLKNSWRKFLERQRKFKESFKRKKNLWRSNQFLQSITSKNFWVKRINWSSKRGK